MASGNHKTQRGKARAGLPEALPVVDEALRGTGIDPDRLSVLQFGSKSHPLIIPLWLRGLLMPVGDGRYKRN